MWPKRTVPLAMLCYGLLVVGVFHAVWPLPEFGQLIVALIGAFGLLYWLLTDVAEHWRMRGWAYGEAQGRDERNDLSETDV